MDTRDKIVRLDGAVRLIEAGGWLLLPGAFDPLTAAQARRVNEAAARSGRKVMAVVQDGRETLLSADARAALVAGLREVSAVVICDQAGWARLRAGASEAEVLEDAAGEAARSAEFVQFVRARQRAAGERS